MQKQPSFQNSRSCESNEPIVLFVIACLILVSSLVMLALTAWYFYDSAQPPVESVEFIAPIERISTNTRH